MCNKQMYLAKVEQERYVVCCEHGLTHIVWDYVSLRFNTHDLQSIALLVQESAQIAAQFRIANNGIVSIILNQHDRFQVWIADGGFYLSI